MVNNEGEMGEVQHNSQGTWIFITILVFVIGLATGFVGAKLLTTTDTADKKEVVENKDDVKTDNTTTEEIGDDSAAGVVDVNEVKKGDITWLGTSSKTTKTPIERNGMDLEEKEVGRITKGALAGFSLFDVRYTGGMGEDARPARILKKGNEVYFLEAYSLDWQYDEMSLDYKGMLKKRSDISIAELDVPGTLTLQNGATLVLRESPISSLPELSTKVTTKEGYVVVSYVDGTQDYGYLLQTIDGVWESYVYEIPFVEGGTIKGTLNSGAAIKGNYTYGAAGGCGFAVNMVLAPAEITMKDLNAVGVVNDSKQSLYALKNTNHPYLLEIYNTYKQFPVNGTAVSYKQFLAANPVLFWQDPWGRLVRFINLNYVAGAECGKPVIYLYPTEKTEVNVKVAPKGGFSVTEPQYPEGGWNVVAYPEGDIVDVRDNKVWPYLFWEGNGSVEGVPNKKGFVVAQREVEKTLREKLALLGLNKQETKDFIEFWLPRMQKAPYYFITFYDNALMNSIAPLSITPKPDSVIRILMDYEPLTAPRNVEPLKIITPQRNGFTVVEWGGVLK